MSAFYIAVLLASMSYARDYIQVPGVVHVHTDVTMGYPIGKLVALARKYGIEAIVLTDNYSLRFEYGIFPFRKLLRKVVELPSVSTFGIGRYMDMIRRAQEEHPEVVLVSGVEVTPHYFWTGSLLKGNLTMHDSQKNILVVGLRNPEDYEEMGRIIQEDRYFGPGSVLRALPVVFILPGIWLLRRGRRTLGGAMIVLAVASSVNNFPYTLSRYDAYSEGGVVPHQRLIDFVEAKGGMTFWSFPEARDFEVIKFGKLGSVTVRTEPYPELLLNTKGYTGFGALYEDVVTATEPGNVWDRVLTEYCEGRRERPVWGIGEAGFHYEGQAGKRLCNVLTVFLVPKKDEEDILEAMRSGRMYAVLGTGDTRLVLDKFTVNGRALMGDRLVVEGNPTVHLRVEERGGRKVPVSLRLVRSGEVVRNFEGTTPLEATYEDTSLWYGTAFYRVEVFGPSSRIVSNPIFVTRLASF